MEAFIYAGSKRPASNTLKFCEILQNTIQESSIATPILVTPNSHRIMECDSNFEDLHTDNIHNDLREIKNLMLTSGIIVIASPVYLHHLSGSTKILLDQISNWTHTMDLVGKLGVIVSCASSTGNQDVNNYLTKIMEYMGVAIVQQVSIVTSQYEGLQLDSMMHEQAESVVDTISACLRYGIDVSERQETVFKTYKHMVLNRTHFSKSELSSLDKRNVQNFQDFQEYFDYHFEKYKKTVNLPL